MDKMVLSLPTDLVHDRRKDGWTLLEDAPLVGSRFVPYLDWDGDEWDLYWFWLEDDWDGDCRLVRLGK